MINVLKRLAPRYWLGYYTVYVLIVIAGMIRCRRSLLDPTGNEDLYTMAAIFGVGAGVALTSAIITEAVGYVVLLIPRRIREIKEEGRAEAHAEGRQEERREERARVARLRARYERGEIALDEFIERVSDAPGDHCDVCHRPR